MALPHLEYEGPSNPASSHREHEHGNAWEYLDTLYNDSYRGYGTFNVPIQPGYAILRNLEERIRVLEEEIRTLKNESRN